MFDPNGPFMMWALQIWQLWMNDPFGPNGPLVQGFILATGIIGQQYVAHMNVRGFYYWGASNIALIAYAYYFKSYGMLFLYLYFGAMSVYSIIKWKRIQASKIPA